MVQEKVQKYKEETENEGHRRHNMTVAEALMKRNLTWVEARRIEKGRTKRKKIVHEKDSKWETLHTITPDG